MASRNVGIIDYAIYVPNLFVKLSDLEIFDEISPGKYTIGLGQNGMSVCTDREDVNSICLTVVDRLIRKNNVCYKDIGRLDVGTETLIDKSKSVKTVIMQLFTDSGNFNVEGADNVNACYGGTAALFNTVDWMESSAWDGRYGIVVMADIAVYKDKAARPTGGAGAIALLIGPNAPIIMESEYRGTVSSHQYDFYKPDMSSDYPVVDGNLSIDCYLKSVISCYQIFKKRFCSKYEQCMLEDFCKIAFHSPFCGLVKKAFALLSAYDEIESYGKSIVIQENSIEIVYDKTCLINFVADKQMQKHLMSRYASKFKDQTEPTLQFARNIGNSYTSSVYLCLISALSSLNQSNEEDDARILIFSYGSGLIASMFTLRLVKKSANNLIDQAYKNVNDMLSDEIRTCITPSQMEKLQLRNRLSVDCECKLSFPIELISNDCFYLHSIDKRLRRTYKRQEDNTHVNIIHDINALTDSMTEV